VPDRLNVAVLQRLARAIGRASKTRYPRFLFGFSVAAGVLPVFVYHQVEPEELAADLAFLRDNRYAVLPVGEFFDCSIKRLPRKAVLITFDDGRRNFWDVAFPVIREFSAMVTLFVPSLWILGSTDRDGDMVAAEERKRFMTWQELGECVASGLVSVQPHGHRHALVYTSNRLMGFACPEMLARYDVFDWPMRRESGHDLYGLPPLGTPIYQAAPLLSATHRVLEPEGAVRACRELVQAHGGAAFFRRTDWARRLLATHERVVGRRPAEVRMPDLDFHRLVASEFERSVGTLRAQLGQAGEFFAYPWMLGTDESVRLAQQAGIRAVFGVGLDQRRARRADLPVPMFSRVKSDWLRRLPGRGRSSLVATLGRKVVSLPATQHLAH
jgi:peptidoglycan/xylan/chitin deacetylase (PgdA/CDA1 family)